MTIPIPLQQPHPQPEQIDGIDWPLFVHFTGLALQGMVANQGPNIDARTCAARACEIAQAAVKELLRRRK